MGLTITYGVCIRIKCNFAYVAELARVGSVITEATLSSKYPNNHVMTDIANQVIDVRLHPGHSRHTTMKVCICVTYLFVILG